MWLGQNKNSLFTPMDIKWKKHIKILGITFTYDKTEAFNLNYNRKLNDLEKTLNLWKMRDLSLLGRILITKTLGIPKFIFTASVMVIIPNV